MAREALIVETEAVTSRLLAEHLADSGYGPTAISDLSSAIGWARQNQPDLVFLDSGPSERNGFTFCEKLKLDPVTNLIPILMVIQSIKSQNHVPELHVAPNGYLIKPVTVEQINRAVSDAGAWKISLHQEGMMAEIHFCLPSHVVYLDQLNGLLVPLLLGRGLSEDHVERLTIAVRELGYNAIEWGHHNQVEQIVTVIYRATRDQITLAIVDNGPGFNPHQVPHAARPGDPIGHLEARDLLGLREGGFGIMLARGLVDELQYNERGNEVRLVKYISQLGPAREGASSEGTA